MYKDPIINQPGFHGIFFRILCVWTSLDVFFRFADLLGFGGKFQLQRPPTSRKWPQLASHEEAVATVPG